MKNITILVGVILFSSNIGAKSIEKGIYPLDRFTPLEKFTATDPKEFLKKYRAEADPVFKKGEFETTTEYNKRIIEFKPKSLDQNKVYAFKIDTSKIQYNVDQQQYEIPLKIKDNTDLKVAELTRFSSKYVGSNAYGRKETVLKLRGSDLYIKQSKSARFNRGKLVVPVDVETAKKYQHCKKELVIFTKFNDLRYSPPNDFDFSEITMPKLNLPLDIQIQKITLPMDMVGTTLQCANGQIISSNSEEERKNIEKEIINNKELKQIEVWKTDVLNKVLKHWKKPESLEGMVDTKMSVLVDRNGRLLNLKWVERTNNRKLDRSIVNAFKDAAPFAPPPITDLSLPNLTVIITFPAQK